METLHLSTVTLASNTKDPLTLHRPGYGTMRLTGDDFIGQPADRPQAIRILQAAVEAGVNYIDTADFYGPGVTNELIVEALHPYPSDLIIGTKIGVKREGKDFKPFCSPDDLRKSVDNNLKELKIDQLPLVHFRHMSACTTAFEKCLEAMYEMQQEGLIQHVGLSNVSQRHLRQALRMGKIASVQNLFGYSQRESLDFPHGVTYGGAEVLALCEENEIVFIPYFSLHTALPRELPVIKKMAEKYRLTPAQMNIAWLMNLSEWILPIPGTSSLAHLEENIAAAEVEISEDDMNELEDAVKV